MSQHVVKQGDKKFVFGWDQNLNSFFLQKHDLTIEEKDLQIVLWLGTNSESEMYEVEQLVQTAREHGLTIPVDVQSKLYLEKDEGR